MSKNSEYLQWLHNRIVNTYGENRDVDFLIRFRKIIKETEELEVGFQEYLDYIEKDKKKNHDTILKRQKQ